ncbi:pyrroline-5-carboxylate reductase, mitochondrial [Pelomyxa schiedti]|nr:pyrroline-5-carboxylate reductase, mitochondrial [Pelomyxa schiedti]
MERSTTSPDLRARIAYKRVQVMSGLSVTSYSTQPLPNADPNTDAQTTNANETSPVVPHLLPPGKHIPAHPNLTLNLSFLRSPTPPCVPAVNSPSLHKSDSSSPIIAIPDHPPTHLVNRGRSLSEPILPSWEFSILLADREEQKAVSHHHSAPTVHVDQTPEVVSLDHTRCVIKKIGVSELPKVIFDGSFRGHDVEILVLTHMFYMDSSNLIELLLASYQTNESDEVHQKVLSILERWAKYLPSQGVLCDPISDKIFHFVNGSLKLNPKHKTTGDSILHTLKESLVNHCKLTLSSPTQTLMKMDDTILFSIIEEGIWWPSHLLKTRKKSLVTPLLKKKCFPGDEMIAYTLEKCPWLTKEQILEIGTTLISQHKMMCLSKEQVFREDNRFYGFIQKAPMKFPKPIVPSSKTITFFDLSPLEVARQLTIMEADIFLHISFDELTTQGWNKSNPKERERLSPTIVKSIAHFNWITYWVASEVVLTPNLRQRICVLHRIIQIAQACMSVSNFNSAIAICIGLQLFAVTRLKKTWQGITQQESQFVVDTANDVLLHNLKNYRVKLSQSQLPTIPYLGMWLKDLTVESFTKQDFLEAGVINWKKMTTLAAVYAHVYHFQSRRHPFRAIPSIISYLKNAVAISNTDTLIDKSILCESNNAH